MGFDELIAEGAAAPVEGWDFSWFEGRATEERPSWGYAGLLAGRLGEVGSALDLQTGGGEVFSWALDRAARRPDRLAATESWAPNTRLAEERLRPAGAVVVRAADDGGLPFAGAAFGLVSSRHPVQVEWPEVARVLAPGGTFLSQMVGAGSNRGLYEQLMGPQPDNASRSPQVAAAEAAGAGLHVVRLEEEALEVAFFDVGAVVLFLRKVPWTVPDFTVDRYLPRLAALHDRIQREGSFRCRSQRYLLEIRKGSV